MNLQQLRYLCGIADHELNISKAAEALHTSQPGVTRQIRQLEEELKAELLVRGGNRIAALTEAGSAVVEIARRVLRDIENIRSAGTEYADANKGTLSVATTHVHARYILMPVAQRFRQRFPNVGLSIRQGNPDQIAQLVSTRRRRPGPCIRTDRGASYACPPSLLSVSSLRASTKTPSAPE